MKHDVREIEYKEKGLNQQKHKGYFHKWATIQNYDYCSEFVVIEDLDGRVKLINLEDYEIEFIDREVSKGKVLDMEIGGQINE